MKVKIGNKIYDSNKVPIMLILEKTDKFNLSHMAPEAYKYCSYPHGIKTIDVYKFMEVDRDKKSDKSVEDLEKEKG